MSGITCNRRVQCSKSESEGFQEGSENSIVCRQWHRRKNSKQEAELEEAKLSNKDDQD